MDSTLEQILKQIEQRLRHLEQGQRDLQQGQHNLQQSQHDFIKWAVGLLIGTIVVVTAVTGVLVNVLLVVD